MASDFELFLNDSDSEIFTPYKENQDKENQIPDLDTSCAKSSFSTFGRRLISPSFLAPYYIGDLSPHIRTSKSAGKKNGDNKKRIFQADEDSIIPTLKRKANHLGQKVPKENSVSDFKDNLEQAQMLPEPSTPKSARFPFAAMQNSPDLNASLCQLYTGAAEAGYYSAKKINLGSNLLFQRAGRKAKAAIQSHKDSLLARMQMHIEDMMYLKTPLHKRYETQRTHVETSKMEIKPFETSVTVSGKYWFKNSIRGAEVRGVSSYEKIAKQLSTLSKEVPDKVIAQTIWELVRDEEITYKDNFTINQLNLIGKITYLLFAVEPGRHETSLIINAMFLDMVLDGICDITFIQNLPMSIKGAKGHIRQWQTLTKESSLEPLKTDPKLLESLGGDFFARHIDLVTIWAKNNMGIENLEHKHLQDLARIINDKIEDWFRVKITPPKFSLQESPDSGFDSDFSSFSDLELAPLYETPQNEEMNILGES